MSKILTTKQRRKKRVSLGIIGTLERPRVSVFRSNKHLYAQIINDSSASTLVALHSQSLEKSVGNKTDKALELGKKLGAMAIKQKITMVVFDRGSSAYKGRVKAFAEGLRESGLIF